MENSLHTLLKVNGNMISLAREVRGLTQGELAEKLGVTQVTVSRAEADMQGVTEENLSGISNILQFPESFFYQKGELLPSNLNYRKRLKVAQKLLAPIEAEMNIYRLNIQSLLEKMKFPVEQLLVFDLSKSGMTAQEAAIKVRKSWKIPSGPLLDLTDYIESHGIIVINWGFDTERVDSRSILTKQGHPVICLNSLMLGDRQRFTLAHELGHLLMHQFTQPSFERDIEREASKFAAELLMPEKDIRADLEGGLTVPKLAELKRKWKVSMQAILYRAKDLDILTDNQIRYILGQFNALKIRRREPPELDVPKESPKLLRELITRYKRNQKLSVKQMAEILHLTEEEFLKKYSA